MVRTTVLTDKIKLQPMYNKMSVLEGCLLAPKPTRID
jgi:hypothetical protein